MELLFYNKPRTIYVVQMVVKFEIPTFCQFNPADVLPSPCFSRIMRFKLTNNIASRFCNIVTSIISVQIPITIINLRVQLNLSRQTSYINFISRQPNERQLEQFNNVSQLHAIVLFSRYSAYYNEVNARCV